MQISPTLDIVVIGMPGLFLGLIIGYIVGGMPSFRLVDRIGLGIIISGAGGLIFSLVFSSFILISSLEPIFIILAFAGGYCLGLSLNWESPAHSGSKKHIVYEPDDDDAFDREIEKALGGKE